MLVLNLAVLIVPSGRNEQTLSGPSKGCIVVTGCAYARLGGWEGAFGGGLYFCVSVVRVWWWWWWEVFCVFGWLRGLEGGG